MAIDISSLKNKNEKASQPSIAQREFSFSKKLSLKLKASFYKDFATLLRAGVDFKTCFELLIEQQKKSFVKIVFTDIMNEVIKGSSLHEALSKRTYFSDYEVFSIKIGEETKKLDHVFLELHQYFERQIKLRKQIINVMTYPCFVLLLTFGVLYFMMLKVVPMFSSVFRQFGGELPQLTQKVILLSQHFSSIITVLILLLLSVILFYQRFKNTPWFRQFLTNVLLRIPFVGNMLKRIYMARFCQFMNLQISAKTPLIDSLEMVGSMIGFYPIESSIPHIKTNLLRGMAFSEALKKHTFYDYRFVSMLKVAEEVNELDHMFSRLSKEYEEQIEQQTKMLGVVLEPILILFIGSIVGVIMIAMYAPMFDLSKIINK